MKKVSIVFLLLSSFFFYSCRKDYTCGCSWDRVVNKGDGSGNDTIPYREKYDIKNTTELDAKDKCLGYEIVTSQEGDRINVQCITNEKE